jgi:SPP1 gp7 family putative phage head morphogenesis protein
MPVPSQLTNILEQRQADTYRTYGRFLSDPPALWNLDVEVKQSNASAHGFYYLVAPRLWDALDEMYDKDAVIGSCVDLLVSTCLMRPAGLKYTKEGAAQPSKASRVLDALQNDVIETPKFQRLLWFLLQGAIMHGVSACEVTWESEPGVWKPLEYFHLHPGQLVFERDGSPVLYHSGEPCTPNKYVVATTAGLYSCPWGKSLTFPLRYIYYFSKGAFVGFSRYVTKFGIPLIHATIPTMAGNADGVRADLEAAIQNLESDDWLVTEHGETINIHDRSGRTVSTSHGEFLHYADSLKQRRIFGSELTSTIGINGTRALGEVHERTGLTRALPYARMVEDSINCSVLDAYVAYNFGPAYAGLVRWDINTDTSRSIEEVRTVLETANKVGLVVAASEARELLGLREVTEEDTETINTAPVQETAPEMTTGTQEKVSFSEQGNETRMRKARAAAKRMSDKVFKMGTVLADDTRPDLLGVWGHLLAHMHDKRADAVVEKGLGYTVSFDDMKTEDDMCRMKFSAVLLSALGTDENIRAQLGEDAVLLGCVDAQVQSFDAQGQTFTWKKKESPLDALPEDYREAADWMTQRDIATVEEIERAASAIARAIGEDIPQFTRELRRDALALAHVGELKTLQTIRTYIADAALHGRTYGDFREQISGMIESGKLPGGLDHYWRNVYRTETANAYSAQQEAWSRSPGIASHVWGFELYNPQDERSRPTHAALSGQRFKKDSAAWAALGRPPFDFQCRCCAIEIMDIEPATADYKESKGALSLAGNLLAEGSFQSHMTGGK